jgi:hypothetical protein
LRPRRPPSSKIDTDNADVASNDSRLMQLRKPSNPDTETEMLGELPVQTRFSAAGCSTLRQCPPRQRLRSSRLFVQVDRFRFARHSPAICQQSQRRLVTPDLSFSGIYRNYALQRIAENYSVLLPCIGTIRRFGDFSLRTVTFASARRYRVASMLRSSARLRLVCGVCRQLWEDRLTF